MVKRIPFLAGSHFQVAAMRYGHEAGYYVITCNYLPDNPSHKYAYEFHNVNATNSDKVLKLAKEKNIDGIVIYASGRNAV